MKYLAKFVFWCGLFALTPTLLHAAVPTAPLNKTDWAKLAQTYDNILPVAVIGSGCAGLPAAMVGAQDTQHTVVFQGEKKGGALNVNTPIGNWPSTKRARGDNLMPDMIEQTMSWGAILCPKSIVAVDFSSWPFKLSTHDGQIVHALSVVIATGTSNRPLNVPGAREYLGKERGIVQKLERNDINIFKNKRVVIVGSGDDAMFKAYHISKRAGHVTILVRGNKIRALGWRHHGIVKRANRKNSNITIQFQTQIKKITGNGQKVTHVELDNGSIIEADYVVASIGRIPNNQLFKQQIKLDDKGYIVLKDSTQATSIPGVFAAGDIAGKNYGQGAIASGDGMKAGYDCIYFLENIGYDFASAKMLDNKLYRPADGVTGKRRGGGGLFGLFGG